MSRAETSRDPPRRLQRRRASCKRCQLRSASMERRDDPCSSSSAAASSAPRLKEELLCPICYEPFREAVTLPCGHNFCRSCICKSWENRTHACPLCKERSSLDELRINHTLRNLVELILKEEGPWRGGGAALCSAHQQEPKFFCLEDKELACFGCQNSKEHEGHKMRPVQEAAADFRAKLANMETSLRDKAKDFAAVRRSFEAISRHNEVESGRLESQVKWEFEKLHKFLWDEEQAVLAQLREETGRKQDLIQAKLQQLADATQALLNEAARLQADLQQDDLTFLMTHKNRKRRIACTAEEPEAVPPGIVVDVAKYLGSLQYNVWKKMLDTITAFPFSLDPNSAAGWLSISEDLSSVSSCCYKGSVDNPERFTSAPCILGSRGFSEGFHTWEVDLGGLTNWRVGVSRPHKGSHWSCHHDSRSGFWYIYHLHGKDECRASNAVRSQTALGNIRRVRVELDCTEGELSFYDADLQSHIYTFHEKFGGVVFPYFYIGSSQGDANTKTLRICPLRIRVREDVLT
ncbi:E3 ubiquitin-protein ligase TRIM35 [Serinus canaria]|uniref:E3 ubiquitin-protein ligase TRIM35 n=1 Tax=Serinus canaria TaxID=9135 RepID=UPI0021CC8BBB|nr:E3 ubiquitin-protein ligase TRIM35 [Serinus canaria]